MLYLIGGASRSGKTLVAQYLLEKHQVPRFSVDYFTTALQRGNPSLGIRHEENRVDRSNKLWPYLKPLLSNLLHEEPSYTVEGEALSPRLVSEFLDENPDRARACFLGYSSSDLETKLADTKTFTGRINNWIAGVSPEEVRNCIASGIQDSRDLERDCTAYRLQFFDISSDFHNNIQLVGNFLKNGSLKEL